MFRNQGFIFRKTVVYTRMVYHVLCLKCISISSFVGRRVCSNIIPYNHLSEDEPSGSKHVEHIKN